MKRIIPLFILAIVIGGICESFFAKSESVYVARKSVIEVSKFDKPSEAAEFENFITQNKEGEVPKEKLNKAFLMAKKTVQKRIGLKSAISGVSWEEVGPNNVGGRTRALMWDPNDVNHTKVWAGGVSGGIWYKDDIFDINTPWQNVNDFMANLAISSIVHDDLNPNVFYAGTGEGYYSHAGVRGAGMYKSTDGGATWSALSSTLEPAANFNFDYVQSILVSSGRIIVSTRSRYCNRGGVLYSDDGGNTWSSPFTGDGINCGNGDGNDYAGDIAQATNGDIYVSFGFAGDSDGIYKSTDNGTTWVKVYNAQSNEGRIELATAPSNSNVVYGLIEGYSVNAKIIKTTNAGASWAYTSIPMYYEQSCLESSTQDWTRGQDSYDLIAIVDPNNSNKLTVGGIDLHRSDDGGNSWYPISYWTGNCYQYVHADQHFAIYNPHNSEQLIFGNDGGVAVTENASANMPNIYHNNNGYNVTQFYAGAMPNNTDDIYLAGAQDNGSQLINTSVFPGNASQVTGGDGAFCHIDQDNPDVVVTSYVYNNYFVSTDGGNNFNSYFLSDNGRFINPTIYSSANNTLIGAGNEDEFFTLNINGSNTNPSVNLGGGYITALAFDPANENNIYVATINRDIYKISDIYGSPSASFISQIPASLDAFGYPKTLAFGSSSDDIYIVRSNYDLKSVVHYNQATSTWSDKTGNLPSMPVRWIWVNPENSNEAMIATETGVWSTDDISATSVDWGATNMDLANVRVDHLAQRNSDKKVLASTHGRGMFTTDDFNSQIEEPGDTLYSENFADGFSTGWSESSENGAVWEWRGPSTTPYNVYYPLDGACSYRGLDTLLNSETQSNGYMVFDGNRNDFGTYDSGNPCATSSVGLGENPGPFNASLESPTLDLSTEDDSLMANFFVDARTFDGSKFWFEASNDNGSNWISIQEIFAYNNVAVNAAFNGFLSIPVDHIVGGASNAKFRLRFEGSHYHAIVDDFSITKEETTIEADVIVENYNMWQSSSKDITINFSVKNEGDIYIDSSYVAIEYVPYTDLGNPQYFFKKVYNLSSGQSQNIFAVLDLCDGFGELSIDTLLISVYPDIDDYIEESDESNYQHDLPVEVYCNTCPVDSLLTECEGSLDDGSGDFNYVENSTCTWLIDPASDDEVVFTIDSMYLEYNYDHLYLYDGSDDQAPLLAALNGEHTDTTVVATSGALYIKQVTDYGTTFWGWQGHWYSNCGITTLYSEDFSDSLNTGWVIYSDNAANWEWRGPNTSPYDVYFPLDNPCDIRENQLIESTTPENGYMVFDGGRWEMGTNAEANCSLDSYGNGSAPGPFNSHLISPIIDLSSYPESSVSFFVDARSYDSELFFQISFDGGSSWETIGDIFQLYGTQFQGRVELPVSDFVGQSNQVQFKFLYVGHLYHAIIDDFEIIDQAVEMPTRADIEAVAINYYQENSGQINYSVHYRNSGTATIDSTTVRIEIYDENSNFLNVSNEHVLYNIQPGDTVSIFNYLDVCAQNSIIGEADLTIRTYPDFYDWFEGEKFWYNFTNVSVVLNCNTCPVEEEITDCSGLLDDGSEDFNYNNNRVCSWLINPAGDTPIEFTVDSMYLEDGYDFLIFMDGDNPEADTLAILTGNLYNQVITSTGGSMYLRMLSDEGVTNYGWYGGWTNGCPEANLCRQTGDFDYFDDNIVSKRIHAQEGYSLSEENGELHVSIDKAANWNNFYFYVEDLDLSNVPIVSFDIKSNDTFDIRVDLEDNQGIYTDGNELRYTYDGNGQEQHFHFDLSNRFYDGNNQPVDAEHINWIHVLIEPGESFSGNLVMDGFIVGDDPVREFSPEDECEFVDLEVTGGSYLKKNVSAYDFTLFVTNNGNVESASSDLALFFRNQADGLEGSIVRETLSIQPGDTVEVYFREITFGYFGESMFEQTFDVYAYADWYAEVFEPNIRNNEFLGAATLTYDENTCQDTTYLTDCSGAFDDGSGTENYANNKNCNWIIQSPDDSPISLSFSSIDLEADYDSIIVTNGLDGIDVDTLAVFSGHFEDTTIASEYPFLHVQFKTDLFVSGAGFDATWSTCEELDVDLAFNSALNIVQTDTATVSTQFEIINNGSSTASGYQYRINFQNVATGFTGGITYTLPDLAPDSVYYHDSETYMCYFKNQVNQDFKFYVDLNLNGLTESNYDNNSDTTIVNLTLTCTECDGLTEYSDCEASFALEGGNGTYTNSQNCAWYINPDEGGPIKVDFFGFDVDFTDTLWVTNSSDDVIDILTGQLGDTGIYYLEDEILLSFQNSGNDNATGFSAITTCGVDMVDYQPLDFNINASGKGSITYSVSIRNNGSGSRDSSSFNLSFFDENWNYLGYTGQWVLNLQGGETREITSFNGALNLCNLLSSTQFEYLNVVLGVDNDINVNHEEYDESNNEIQKQVNIELDCDVCNGVTVLNDCLGTFNDGSDELNYDPEKYCSWQITSSNSDDIQLTFTEFNTEIDFDFVRVFDGTDSNSTLLGKFSGNNIPDTLIATSGNMFVDFNSDKYIVESGFIAKYECLQEVTENDVVFSLGSASAGQNSTVSIPVFVDQFIDMGGFSGKITFDENVFTNPVVEAVDIPNPNGFTVNTTVAGEISFLWEASDFVNGHDVANGSVVFNLNLDVGEAEGDFIIDALTNQANWSVSTFDAQAKGVVLNNGLVSILNTAIISGTVATVNNELVDNSLVSVVSGGDTVNTEAVDGVYSLNVAPGNMALGIYNTEGVQPVRGINIIDIIGLRRHILGLSVYDEVREMVAADVNFDGNINIIDIISLRRIILGLSSDFNGDLWKYIPVDNDLTTSDYVRDTYFDFEVSGNSTIDFEAIKLGDVNFDWTNPNAKTEKVIDLSLQFGEPEADGFMPVYLPYEMQLNAIQFTLSATQEIKEVKKNLFELSLNENNKFMVSGIWDSETAEGLLIDNSKPLFYVKTKGDISFTDYPTQSLLAHNGIEIKSFDGSTNQATLVRNGADMNCISVYPVPVSNKLVLDACKDVNIKSITWLAADGRVVLCSENVQNAKQWEINSLPSTGAYVIKIESNIGVSLESIIVK